MFIKNNSCHAETIPRKRTTRPIAALNRKQFVGGSSQGTFIRPVACFTLSHSGSTPVSNRVGVAKCFWFWVASEARAFPMDARRRLADRTGQPKNKTSPVKVLGCLNELRSLSAH